MNKVLLILTCVFITLNTIGQDIPKKSNTIVVKGVSFNEAANRLLDAGYNIDKKDESLQTISTTPVDRKKPYSLTVHVRVKDSTAIITGTFKLEVEINLGSVTGTFGNSPVEYRGMKGSIYKSSFEDLNKIATSFGKPVQYLIN